MPSNTQAQDLGQKNIWVTAAAHRRLAAIMADLRAARGRTVTFAEVVDELLDERDRTDRLLREVKETRR